MCLYLPTRLEVSVHTLLGRVERPLSARPSLSPCKPVILWQRLYLPVNLSFWRSFVSRRLVFASLVTLSLVSVSAVLLMAGPTNQKVVKASASASKAASSVSQAPITVDGVKDIDPDKSYGSKNAGVVLETFTDFQCPACKQLYTTTLQRVMDNYVDNNKIYMVHRDFPLPMHAYSRVAASYARAACHVGKCDAVEQTLFQNQEKWEANGDVKGTVAAVLTPAEMKRVQALVESGSLEPLIERDKQLGQAVPVNQTPTMVIHTKDGQSYPVVGYVSYDTLKTLLDQLVK
jgi:protein-disulfide isomerase